MVAVAQFIPTDPDQKASVLAVLREHPELSRFILRASEKAKEVFPDIRVTLDTVRYDEWDPPVSMTIHVTQPWSDFVPSFAQYRQWLSYDADYPRSHILVMPVWSGPLESSR